ncbi:hypothetical protein TUN205_11399 [Pyrenophora tritici-repentis]|nr:hypothetical protein TUN205_11399 [Pyrenophora tritici-repentis]
MSSLHHSSLRQYDTPYQSVQQTECTVHPHVAPENDSGGTEGSFRSDQWAIGWATPLIMVFCFLIATTTAVGHYCYCLYLNRKFVEDTIPQDRNTAISMSFARLFSTALATSASTAFTQLLWWFLRHRSIPLSKIDALFSINSSPLNLYRLSILKAVPLLWVLGLVIPLISVATIFPPGTLVVQQLPELRNQSFEVPILDVDDRGNGSAVEFFSNAMFTHGGDGEYREELSNIYHGSQLRSIRDTLVQALSGAISTFGAENYFTINTIMQESKRADPVYNMSMFTFSSIFFDLSTSVVEDYMKNVTIAMLNDSGKNYSTLVETTIYKSAYVFKNELRLIGAYGGALFLCLAFLLLGFGALHQNGTSASTGGFLQIMCTTTHGDGTMNQLAKGASLGGEIGVPKDLLDLKVRFGVVANSTGQTKHAAFGTVEDTEPLVRGL